jgi:hypothetical protein
MLYHAILSSYPMLCCVILCSVMLNYVMLCYLMLCYGMLYYGMYSNAMQCNAMSVCMYSTITYIHHSIIGTYVTYHTYIYIYNGGGGYIKFHDTHSPATSPAPSEFSKRRFPDRTAPPRHRPPSDRRGPARAHGLDPGKNMLDMLVWVTNS